MPACAPAQLLQSRAASRCSQVRAKLPLDGNAAAFFKCVGELAVHANDLPHARELFVESVPLFREVWCSCALILFAAISQSLCIHSRCYVAVGHCRWQVMWAVMIEVFECRRSPWIAPISWRSAWKSSISSTASASPKPLKHLRHQPPNTLTFPQPQIESRYGLTGL